MAFCPSRDLSTCLYTFEALREPIPTVPVDNKRRRIHVAPCIRCRGACATLRRRWAAGIHGLQAMARSMRRGGAEHVRRAIRRLWPVVTPTSQHRNSSPETVKMSDQPNTPIADAPPTNPVNLAKAIHDFTCVLAAGIVVVAGLSNAVAALAAVVDVPSLPPVPTDG